MTPEVDYRSFRLRWINEPQFRHLWWLLFFPLYWLRYPLIENLNPAQYYHPSSCPLDDWIPFSEWFIIPYGLWMVCLLALCLYTLLYDTDSFRRYMKYLSITMAISTVIFLLYPSCQNLRPAQLPERNILCAVVELLYTADTNTNVFPSEHVTGALVMWVAAMHTESLRKWWSITAVTVLVLLICASTVFLKQHSVLDVAAAVPVCAIAYPFCYPNKKRASARK